MTRTDSHLLTELLLIAKGWCDQILLNHKDFIVMLANGSETSCCKSTFIVEMESWKLTLADTGPSPSLSVQRVEADKTSRELNVSDKWGIFNGASAVCPVALARLFFLVCASIAWKSLLVGLKTREKLCLGFYLDML